MIATDKLKQEVLKRVKKYDEYDYHQTIMNIMYEHWQKEDVKMNYREILEWFELEYGVLARFAVQIGKYNQQVCNGGHFQYYHNGFMGDTNSEEIDISLHQELVVMLNKSELKDDTSLKVFKILQELYIEIDNDCYVEEAVEDEDGNIVYEDVENDNYMSIVNTDMLSNFDKEYYKANDEFMEILEKYFKDKITMINPVWDYQDDYYFANIDDKEINIRIFEDDSIGIWIYDSTLDEEIIDDDLQNMEKIQDVLKDIFKENITVPSIEQLKKIRTKEER